LLLSERLATSLPSSGTLREQRKLDPQIPQI